MEWHPFAERFPLLEGDEKAAFDRSIAATGGNEQPILFRMKGGKKQGLDGRNRERSCQEQGIKPTYKLVSVKDEDVKDFILRRNVHRRHMSRELRQAIVSELRADGESTRQIAEAVGVSQSTVVSDLKVSGEQNRSPETVTGKDKKTYPATKPPALCDRCKRVAPGRGLPGCNACAELRGEKTAPPAQTNGAAPPNGKPGKKGAKNSPPADPGPAPEPGDAPDTPPAPLPLDAVNVPIPGQSLESFALLDKFREALRLHRELSRLVDLLARSPGGECFRHAACGLKESGGKQTFFSDKLHTLAYDFKGNQPHAALCPYCVAAGADHNLKTCSACHGLPYVPKTLWSQAPDDYRQAVLARAVKGVNA